MILWQKCILRINSGIHTICHHNLFGVSLQLCHVPFYMNSTHSTLRLHILFLDPSWLVRCVVLTPDSELQRWALLLFVTLRCYLISKTRSTDHLPISQTAHVTALSPSPQLSPLPPTFIFIWCSNFINSLPSPCRFPGTLMTLTDM